MSKLVIVESPAKAKTIRKYLGGGYEVTASMGHIRDLPQSQLGIDVEHGYAPQYINIKGKEKIIKELKSLAKESDEVFLATDPDREGEAISWHLANLLGLDTAAENRVTFGEITKKGVTQGMAAPRAIDMDLFNAQQARRVLDRLVGYKLSPFLWKKVRRGLSAGRVQSVAVRLIVDREKEIEAFKPEEYWNIDALLSPPSSTKKFTARLTALAGGRKLAVTSAGQSAEIVKALDGAAYTVASISKGKRKKVPAPPFITSTMQQEASRRLGFTATRTMRAAQTLYEGVDIAGQGTMGLITYMRTDSLRIADEAQAAAKEFITETYGPEYVCPQKRTYKSKSATAAQDAHEAVRPTNPALTPAEVEKSVSGDPAKLYRLIWSRFIASQMSDCQQDTVSADITAAGYLFRASGYVVTFDGFTTLYEEATDEKEKKETALPPLEEGMVLKLRELKPEQKFTQPPARYTEATLIKALEENGIGRPSTYAPIITTIIDRDYVERDQKKLAPTTLGRVINELMLEQFPNIVDVKFSAQGLSQIAVQPRTLVFHIFIIAAVLPRPVQRRRQRQLPVHPLNPLTPPVRFFPLPQERLVILYGRAVQSIAAKMCGKMPGKPCVFIEDFLGLVAPKALAGAIVDKKHPCPLRVLEHPHQGFPVGKPGPIHRLHLREDRFQSFGQRGEQELLSIIQIGQEKQHTAQQAIIQLFLEFLYPHPGHCLRRHLFQFYHRFIDDQIPAQLFVHKAAVIGQRPLDGKIQSLVIRACHPEPVQQIPKLIHIHFPQTPAYSPAWSVCHPYRSGHMCPSPAFAAKNAVRTAYARNHPARDSPWPPTREIPSALQAEQDRTGRKSPAFHPEYTP